MAQINLEEIWELTAEDGSNSFSPIFLAELIFGSEATDDTVSAFLRCVFEDKLFFKYKEGRILANSPEKVEQLQSPATKRSKTGRAHSGRDQSCRTNPGIKPLLRGSWIPFRWRF